MQKFLVKMYRNDGEDVDIVYTDKYSEALESFRAADKQWIDAVVEKRPFRIENPMEGQLVRSFDPSLIREIVILPVNHEQTTNPYKQQMQRDGLSSMMNSHFDSRI